MLVYLYCYILHKRKHLHQPTFIKYLFLNFKQVSIINLYRVYRNLLSLDYTIPPIHLNEVLYSEDYIDEHFYENWCKRFL